MERMMGIAPGDNKTHVNGIYDGVLVRFIAPYHAASPAFIRHWRRQARVRFPTISFHKTKAGIDPALVLWSG